MNTNNPALQANGVTTREAGQDLKQTARTRSLAKTADYFFAFTFGLLLLLFGLSLYWYASTTVEIPPMGLLPLF